MKTKHFYPFFFCFHLLSFSLLYGSEDVYPLRFSAPEARQGIAVDERSAYVVGSTQIGKYDKKSGKRIQQWQADKTIPLIHLNSGVIHEGKLYCAHSNYPNLPMTSSIEIWDADTLEHIESHSFGIINGSCTWIDRHDGFWWVMFAHYNKESGYPDRSNQWSTLMKMDDQFRRLEAWVFPDEVINRFGRYSSSGGSWGPDGFLYCTGHDAPELYVLRLPKAGSVLELMNILPFGNEGQGIAFDRWQPGILYGVIKKTKTVVADRLPDAGQP